MTIADIMERLDQLASYDPTDLAGMARFGIKVDNAWVISVPKLRRLALELKKEPNRHQLALELWDTKVHEARILAGLIDEPEKVTEEQLEKWVAAFDSWDLCDLVCSNLFDRTEWAYQKATAWATRENHTNNPKAGGEFVKRAGFVLMAVLAVHDKKASNEPFLKFLQIIRAEATDGRNMVKKAINWALRSIGKSRNKQLYQAALTTAYTIRDLDSKSVRWIAHDAIRELENAPHIVKKFKPEKND